MLTKLGQLFSVCKITNINYSKAGILSCFLCIITAGYTEQWADNAALEAGDLGLERATSEEVLAKILELQLSMATAVEVGSEAARRDWRKVCALKHRLQEESGVELRTVNDELEVVEPERPTKAPPSA